MWRRRFKGDTDAFSLLILGRRNAASFGRPLPSSPTDAQGDHLRFILPLTGGFVTSLGQPAPGQDRDCLSTFDGGLLPILQLCGLILPVLPETRVL